MLGCGLLREFSCRSHGWCADELQQQMSLLDLEIEELNEVPSDMCSHVCPNLFRTTSTITKQTLITAVWNYANIAREFPFLRIFLEHESNLELVHNIIPLVSWTNIVATRYVPLRLRLVLVQIEYAAD